MFGIIVFLIILHIVIKFVYIVDGERLPVSTHYKFYKREFDNMYACKYIIGYIFFIPIYIWNKTEIIKLGVGVIGHSPVILKYSSIEEAKKELDALYYFNLKETIPKKLKKFKKVPEKS